MKRVIFIGRINIGGQPIGGETSKNQNLVKTLGKYCNVIKLDFYNNQKHPWIFIQTLWYLLRYPQVTIILSTTASNIYPLLKVIKFLKVKRNIVHWVVGGEFDRLVEQGRFSIDVLNVANFHLVQSVKMVEKLKISGLENVRYVPNIRQISYTPDINKSLHERANSNKIRFVYLSRIKESKGVGEILKCVNILNSNDYQDRFSVDFYGRIDESYQAIFESLAGKLPNVNYNGILNLQESTGYDILSSYHAMLFPTFHPSEGVAGVLVDALIAGLPVVASDWKHNTEIVNDGETGIVVPVHDINALSKTMQKIIDGEIQLAKFAKNSQNMIERYKAENIITEQFLKELHIL